MRFCRKIIFDGVVLLTFRSQLSIYTLRSFPFCYQGLLPSHKWSTTSTFLPNLCDVVPLENLITFTGCRTNAPTNVLTHVNGLISSIGCLQMSKITYI